MSNHPHEHTTHALRDVIEALPRYTPDEYAPYGMTPGDDGLWLRLSDVRAVVHKAATLGAPVAHFTSNRDEGDENDARDIARAENEGMTV